jgi:hypothetical protein
VDKAIRAYASLSQPRHVDPGELAPEQHVDILVDGLKAILQAKMEKESCHAMKKKLFLMERKLSNFSSARHPDRELAIHTASKLLEVASGYEEPTGGHQRVMEVHGSAYALAAITRLPRRAGHLARTSTESAVEALRVLVREEDGAPWALPPDHAQAGSAACACG